MNRSSVGKQSFMYSVNNHQCPLCPRPSARDGGIGIYRHSHCSGGNQRHRPPRTALRGGDQCSMTQLF